jgi:membrane associated rhomboid family serine protease
MTDTIASPAPANPYLILGAAIVLPASGHVLLRVPMRGLQFLFFMVILGWITTKIAPPDASFIGRHAGGFLIYALSVLDAYKIARVRHAKWLYDARPDGNTVAGGGERHT